MSEAPIYTPVSNLDTHGTVTLVKDEKGRQYVKKQSAPQRLTTGEKITPELRELAVKLLQNEYECLRRVNSRFVPQARGIYNNGCRGHASSYIILNYVQGKTLAQAVFEISQEKALNAVTDVAKAIRAAHHSGIMHHDVKPENIVLGPRNAVLVDFGLAKQIGRDYAAEGLGIINTFSSGRYAAPEQRDEKPCKETDIYLLGTALTFVLLSQHDEMSQRRLQKFKKLHELCDKAMHRNPKERPSIDEFIKGLRH